MTGIWIFRPADAISDDYGGWEWWHSTGFMTSAPALDASNKLQWIHQHHHDKHDQHHHHHHQHTMSCHNPRTSCPLQLVCWLQRRDGGDWPQPCPCTMSTSAWPWPSPSLESAHHYQHSSHHVTFTIGDNALEFSWVSEHHSLGFSKSELNRVISSIKRVM